MNFTINSDKSIIFGAKRNEPVDRSVKILIVLVRDDGGMGYDPSSKVRVYVIVKKKKKKKKKKKEEGKRISSPFFR